MNLFHRFVCRSTRWKRTVETEILPWALDGVQLGERVLEVGPGPGVTTDLLRTRVRRLTCVEVDESLAAPLARRLAGTNVTVIREDATRMPLADASFDGAVCFTMLHHVPSPVLQDRLFAEVARVLRPGATFAGVDSRYNWLFGLAHFNDTMVVVDPVTLPDRLEGAGFTDVRVDATPRRFRFQAKRRLSSQ